MTVSIMPLGHSKRHLSGLQCLPRTRDNLKESKQNIAHHSINTRPIRPLPFSNPSLPIFISIGIFLSALVALFAL